MNGLERQCTKCMERKSVLLFITGHNWCQKCENPEYVEPQLEPVPQTDREKEKLPGNK